MQVIYRAQHKSQEELVLGTINPRIKIEITKDGSPTAFHMMTDGQTEKMHHPGGALGESIYVFGPAIFQGFEKKFIPRILSVGLGLGYLEFLTAAYCLLNNEPRTKALSEDFYMETFESDPILIKNLLDYLNGYDSEFTHYYDMILVGIEKSLSVNPEHIIDLLLEAYDSKSWIIRGPLEPDTTFLNKFDVVLYDMYSAKTMDSFWSEEFMDTFLKKTTSSSCIFATYSAKSSLKKSLKNNGFDFKEKPGFQGKRESILAFKK